MYGRSCLGQGLTLAMEMESPSVQHVMVAVGRYNLCKVLRTEGILHAKGIGGVEESKNFLTLWF